MRPRRNRDSETEPVAGTAKGAATEPRYARPKVMLVDLPPENTELLSSAGYNVSRGTFGTPIKVTPADKFGYVDINGTLPNVAEQEVVVVDLKDKQPEDGDMGEPPPGKEAIWQKLSSGAIDSRPALAHHAARWMDRILAHGGIFVFFLDPPVCPDYALAESVSGGLRVRTSPRWSSWDMLSILGFVNRKVDYGKEIDVAFRSIPELARHLEESSFSVTIDRDWHIDDERWHVLARSKYGETVAAAIGPSDGDDKGWVFLLPRVPRTGELLKALLDRLFPALRSALFPHMESGVWIERPEYQLPGVLELQGEIRALEQETEKRIAAVRDRISSERDRYAFLQGILTETGDDLVKAVIATLRTLGFKDVRDADEELTRERREGAADEETQKREDIQIHDRCPLVLTEVKGIGGLPREAGSLQVTKYLAPRMRELDRTDIRGLSIINPQRRLPPLDRERQNVFQGDVLTNAEDQGFGLVTTFDLYRLARGFLRYNWRHEDVVELFYRNGRIEPIPSHYDFVGAISDFWERAGAVAIQLEGELAVGDRIAYELPIDPLEENVESIHLNDEGVDRAETGQLIGVKTSLSKTQARKRTRVYRIRRT